MKKNEYEYKGYRIAGGRKGWYVFPTRDGQDITVAIFGTVERAKKWVDIHTREAN